MGAEAADKAPADSPSDRTATPPGRPEVPLRASSGSGTLGLVDHLLHLITAADWEAAQARGTLAGAPFVHLSTPEQVQLPADRLFAGRTDLLLLAVDPTGLDVRYEPGMPYDPPDMRFPHAYGTVPTSAVVAVTPYAPRPDGTFPPPPDTSRG